LVPLASLVFIEACHSVPKTLEAPNGPMVLMVRVLKKTFCRLTTNYPLSEVQDVIEAILLEVIRKGKTSQAKWLLGGKLSSPLYT